MKKIISVLVMAMCLTGVVKAQFSNSSRVFCYEFVETDDNGMKSQSCEDGRYFFVAFYNGCMGYSRIWSKSDVQAKVFDGTISRYENEALEDAKTIEKSPSFGYNGWGTNESQTVYKYDREYSPGRKYTYRQNTRYVVISGYGWGGSPVKNWGVWNKGNKCFTFSSDKKEMIKWSTSNPGKREYFKLIDVNSVRPNTDFLN